MTITRRRQHVQTHLPRIDHLIATTLPTWLLGNIYNNRLQAVRKFAAQVLHANDAI